MEDNIENPQAFPELMHDPNSVLYYQVSGMTLRDYFAAKAMQAVITLGTKMKTGQEVSIFAYQVADAMLKQRSK